MKCGVIALLGRPNTGKSSLINALLKTRAAIVSPKPQTTRNAVRCIYNDNNSQIIFVDTPGLYIPANNKDRLGRFLADAALNSLEDIDAVIWLIEAKFNKVTPEDLEAARALNEIDKPVILAINKVDEINNKFPAETSKIFENLLTREVKYKIALSAKFNFNIENLIKIIKDLMPEGEPWYDPDILMDTTERFLAAEIIRGKILNLLRDEVPHCTAVEIEEYKSPEEFPVHDNSRGKLRERLYIRAALIVETEGQKAILIGHKGRMIKKIGQSARAELEEITGFKVYLDLWVKVALKWRQSDLILKRLGYA
ncbi:MAG: GTPase Era [Synergistaceae bacterium]|nr:GTPase Era [Synergistaceae bacterium]